MTRNNQDYEIYILTKVINNHLYEVVEVSEYGLNSLLSKHDEMVWKIATKIYSQSGYKVEFSFVRDVLNSWIEVLKERIAAEKVKRAEQAIIESERQAEEAQIQEFKRAKLARLQAERQAEQARIEVERQAEYEKNILPLTRQLEASGRDKKMADIFLKVKDILIEQLCVESDKLTLSSHISNDLGADEIDTRELAMALEEEFDIEIPDDHSLLDSVKKWPPSYNYNSLGDSEPVACTVGEILDYIHQQISEQNLS